MMQLAKDSGVEMFLLLRAYQKECDNLWIMQGILYQLVRGVMKKIMSCLEQNEGEGWCRGAMIIGSYIFHLVTGVQRINTQGTTEMQNESD